MKEITFPTVSALATTYDIAVTTTLDTISGYTPAFIVNVRTNSPGVAIEYFSISNNQAYIRIVRTARDSSVSFTPQVTVVYFKDTMDYN